MMSTTTEYHYYCTNSKDSLISKSSTCQTCNKNDTPGYFTVLPIEKQLSSMLISKCKFYLNKDNLYDLLRR